MFLAIAIGIFGGAWLGYLLASAISKRIAASARRPQIVQSAAIVGAVLLAFPAFLLSFIVGGNLGGGVGAVLLSNLGAEPVGAELGVTFGIGVTLALGLSLGALLGSLAGRLVCGASRGQS